MNKQEEFLWLVQTCLLADAINVAARGDMHPHRHEASGLGMLSNAETAMRASKLIPDSMTASEAAQEFVLAMCSDMLDVDDKPEGSPLKRAAWLQGH